MLKIPKRLVVGYRSISKDIVAAFPTEIRMSKRTKNSPFLIVKETQWLKRISQSLPKKKITNELKDGFKLLKTHKQYMSTTADKEIFYLWHDEYNGHIQITQENLFNLIQTCTIDHNTIVDKLIYDGQEYITEETMNANFQEANAGDDSFKAMKEEMKGRKVLARDMKPGYIYQVPPTKKYPATKRYIVLLGTIENNDERYYITKDVQYSDRYSNMIEGKYISLNKPMAMSYGMSARNRPQQESVNMPDIISTNLQSINETTEAHLYKGVMVTSSTYSNVNYRKTLPGHYVPEDNLVTNGNVIKDINILKGYNPEDYDLIDYLLKNPSRTVGLRDLRNLRTYTE